MTSGEGKVILGILENIYLVAFKEGDTAHALVPGIMVHTGSGPAQAPLVLGRSWRFDAHALGRMAEHPHEGEVPTILLFNPTILRIDSGLTETQLDALCAGDATLVTRSVAWGHLVGVLCDSALWLEVAWGKTRDAGCVSHLPATRLLEKIR